MLRFHQREFNEKRSAEAGLCFKPDFTFHLLDTLLRDRQAEARTRLFSGEIWDKDSFSDRRLDSLSMVFYTDAAELIKHIQIDNNFIASSRDCCLKRIENNIRQRPSEQLFVGHYKQFTTWNVCGHVARMMMEFGNPPE